MNKPVFIKLGGSVLTNKNQAESLATAVLAQIIQTIKTFKYHHPNTPLLIGHGGGSFGHYWAKQYHTDSGAQTAQDWYGAARVADAMGRLNRIIVQLCLEQKLTVMSIQPSASGIAQHQQIQSLAHEPIIHLLKHGVIPIVYGDIIMDSQQGCMIASTETIFANLVPHLQPSKIILVGEQAVYNEDPRINPEAQPIPKIDHNNYQQTMDYLGNSHGIDVTGGMRSKVAAMWHLAQLGLNLQVIICGPDVLEMALNDQTLPIGTVLSP